MNKSNLIKYRQLDSLTYKDIFKLYSKYINSKRVGLLSTFGSGRVLVKSAQGAKIKLKNGKIILDATGGFGVLNHGHNHPRILKARKWASENLKMEVNKSFLSPALGVLSYNLSVLFGNNLQYSFFPNSGSEAIDVALRLSFRYHSQSKHKILFSDRAFHGKSLGPQAISNSGENPIKTKTFLSVDKFKFNDSISLKEKILKSLDSNGESNIAALVIEPFSASTMTECSNEFLLNARHLCRKYKIILIFDEVYTGFFKTGYLFNFMRCNELWPDILCFAKSLGGGKSSIAGVSYTKEISNKCLNDPVGANFLSSTYYGFYEECITAIESLQIAVDESYQNKANNFDLFMKKLSLELEKKSNGQIYLKGSGSLWGLFYERDLEKTQKIISLLPTAFKNDRNFAKKVYLSSAINWLFEKEGVLTALSFGFNTHILISLNFAYQSEDLEKIRNSLLKLCEVNWEKFIPRFVSNMLFKPN